MLRSLINKIKNLTTATNRLTILNGQSKFSQNSPVTEKEIQDILRKKYPTAANITVEDVSGGCGAMFNIYVETTDFKGLSIVKQHRSVYDTLKEQIKNIHGLHVETKAPK